MSCGKHSSFARLHDRSRSMRRWRRRRCCNKWRCLELLGARQSKKFQIFDASEVIYWGEGSSLELSGIDGRLNATGCWRIFLLWGKYFAMISPKEKEICDNIKTPAGTKSWTLDWSFNSWSLCTLSRDRCPVKFWGVGCWVDFWPHRAINEVLKFGLPFLNHRCFFFVGYLRWWRNLDSGFQMKLITGYFWTFWYNINWWRNFVHQWVAFSMGDTPCGRRNFQKGIPMIWATLYRGMTYTKCRRCILKQK